MRWAPDARGRLQRAALQLFTEQGYAKTTVPQITARAGLTTRSFFRHFADKREVIFGGDEVPETAAYLIRAAPPQLSPMEVVRVVLHQVAAARFSGPREKIAAWRQLIDAEDALRDRDARKRADLARAATTAFIERGETPFAATVVAETGALVFHIALAAWLTTEPQRTLAGVVDEILLAFASVSEYVSANPSAQTQVQ